MDTITVKRANIVLDISPDEKDKFLVDGFSVIDEKGNVVEEAIIKDIPTLTAMVESLKVENEKLKNEITKLKSSDSANSKEQAAKTTKTTKTES